MTKLSKKLKEILELMNTGWELGIDHFNQERRWVQKGGCGFGGESKDIHKNANIKFLIFDGLIKSNGYDYPTETYRITNKGRTALQND